MSSELFTWGFNFVGQLGNGSTEHKLDPSKIEGHDSWVKLSAGFQNSFGIKDDNSLWTWGYDNWTHERVYSPIKLEEDVFKVSGGDLHSLIIKTDNTLWASGFNAHGQIGDGSKVPRKNFVKIESPKDENGEDVPWLEVSAGGRHSLGVTFDGRLWSWGQGSGSSPKQIGEDTDWITVSAGGAHSFGIKSDGTLWAWGLNKWGQLGIGTDEPNPEDNTWFWKDPVSIGGEWLSVSAGCEHSIGIQKDGSLWGWGWNQNGEVGNGETTNANAPVKIKEGSWVSVSAGGKHSLALDSDGKLWAWGRHTPGLKSLVPVKMGDESWKEVSASLGYSIGIKGAFEENSSSPSNGNYTSEPINSVMDNNYSWTTLTDFSNIMSQSSGNGGVSVDQMPRFTGLAASENHDKILACAHPSPKKLFLNPPPYIGSTPVWEWRRVGPEGDLYISLDGGSTWNSTRDKLLNTPKIQELAKRGLWNGVACSKDFSKIYACHTDFAVIKSTDYGQTWTLTSYGDKLLPGTYLQIGAQAWSISCSSDGNVILVGPKGGSQSQQAPGRKGDGGNNVCISYDGGDTWQLAIREDSDFRFFAGWNFETTMSDDGSVMYFSYMEDVGNDHTNYRAVSGSAVDLGRIYVSVNGGSTWKEITPGTNKHSWTSIDCSSDGSTVVACEGEGSIPNGYVSASSKIYISHDRGENWEQFGSVKQWNKLSVSDDGSVILATTGGYNLFKKGPHNLFISKDGGVSWGQVNVISRPHAPHISSDGSKILVAELGGNIYGGISTPT